MNINVLQRFQVVKRNISIPVYNIAIWHIRKSLHSGVWLILAALTIPFLMAIKIIEWGFVPAFIGFALALTGGILFLIQIGEVH